MKKYFRRNNESYPKELENIVLLITKLRACHLRPITHRSSPVAHAKLMRNPVRCAYCCNSTQKLIMLLSFLQIYQENSKTPTSLNKCDTITRISYKLLQEKCIIVSILLHYIKELMQGTAKSQEEQFKHAIKRKLHVAFKFLIQL